MAQPKEIFVRLDRCMGCHSCELACAVEHSQSKLLYNAISEKPTPRAVCMLSGCLPTIGCQYCAVIAKMPPVCMPVSAVPSAAPKRGWS